MSTDAHRRQGRLSEMVADDVPPELLEAESRELVQQDTDTPVRHLRIDWPSSSIKGVYAIGSSVPHANPPLYDAPDVKDVEGNATSAVFTSRRSPINVTVLVLHGQGQRTPHTPSSEAPPDVGDPMQLLEVERKNTVFVSARTHLNSACVHVPSYAGRKPLHIKVQTHSGNATVILPHSFNGLLTWKVEAGLFHMSPGAASHAMRLDDKEYRHHGAHGTHLCVHERREEVERGEGLRDLLSTGEERRYFGGRAAQRNLGLEGQGVPGALRCGHLERIE